MAEKSSCVDCGVELDESKTEQTNKSCQTCGAEQAKNTSDEAINKGVAPIRIFATFFALTCVFVASYFIWQSEQNNYGTTGVSSKASAVDKILQEALKINSQTPLMIDPSTRLERVLIKDKKITFIATATDFNPETMDKDLLNEKIGQFFANKYCNDKKSRKALELGISYGNEYYSKKGELLFNATISLNDC